MLKVTQSQFQQFAEEAASPTAKYVRFPAICCLSRGVTEEDIRGWVRQWFLDVFQEYKNEETEPESGKKKRNESSFARAMNISTTEVNHIVKGVREPSWKVIAKITTGRKIRPDDFFRDLMRRARATMDEQFLAPENPAPLAEESLPGAHAYDRGEEAGGQAITTGRDGRSSRPASHRPASWISTATAEETPLTPSARGSTENKPSFVAIRRRSIVSSGVSKIVGIDLGKARRFSIGSASHFSDPTARTDGVAASISRRILTISPFVSRIAM